MYLTRLKLDPRARVTRELRLRPYLLHQAIYRAFPGKDEGGPGRILYRWDTDRNGNIDLLIQSEKMPLWEKADLLHQCTLLEPPHGPKDYGALLRNNLKQGLCLGFRLRANPTVKKQTEHKGNGYRLGILREEDQLKWLKRKAQSGGFEVLHCRVIPEGIIRAENERNLRHLAVRFEGILRINNVDTFIKTLAGGIGPAKAFGFGLLSIAPVRG